MSVARPAVDAAAVEAHVRSIVSSRPADPLDASVVPADVAAELVARHGLTSPEELALLALPVARELADPAISDFRVPAVGIERGGALVLGANLEFPGTDLGTTIHAEGFVPLRVRRRGSVLATLALRSARPCAHCRQLLAEPAAADDLVLVDLEGNRRSLEELYPLAFRPSALGVEGDRPRDERASQPLAIALDDGPTAPPGGEVRASLLAAAASAHAPYSGAPSAVALRLRDGHILAAGCLESVAFNPTVSAAQAAMVELAAARADGPAIVEAWLARTSDGPVDPEPGFRSLLGAVAPQAELRIVALRRAAG